mgnify:CR=1 FL=1
MRPKVIDLFAGVGGLSLVKAFHKKDNEKQFMMREIFSLNIT